MEQLRADIDSSRPMLTKGCCKGNNYEQNLSLDFSDEPFLCLKSQELCFKVENNS